MQGLSGLESPKALAESVDVVITLLTNEAALDDVYGSDTGLLAGRVMTRCSST
jgi:3-hydroxyisobutyrate dehydrogenase